MITRYSLNGEELSYGFEEYKDGKWVKYEDHVEEQQMIMSEALQTMRRLLEAFKPQSEGERQLREEVHELLWGHGKGSN